MLTSKSMLAAGLVSTSLILAACESMPSPKPVSPNVKPEHTNQERLSQHNWTNSRIGSLYLPSAGANKPSLQFSADGRVSGTDGCNRIMGAYTAGTDTLALTQMASTQRACVGDNDRVPERFNAALSKVTHYRVTGDTLKLMDPKGNSVLEFNNFNNNLAKQP